MGLSRSEETELEEILNELKMIITEYILVLQRVHSIDDRIKKLKTLEKLRRRTALINSLDYSINLMCQFIDLLSLPIFKKLPEKEKLESIIKKLENDKEEVMNKRQEYQTMFENFDQKTNQLFNILSTVLKSMKEMESGVTRNLN
jgi:prefoldin subunit 5